MTYIDPVKVSSKQYKVLLENDDVRVLEMSLKAGDKDTQHSHPSETVYFVRGQGHQVNRKRVQRLMRRMGIEAIYRRPRTTMPDSGHKVYPYLLRGLEIDRVNQVWAADITYIPMVHGFMYLVCVMDWHSRYVLSWRLSNTLEADSCVDALEEALSRDLPGVSRESAKQGGSRSAWISEDNGGVVDAEGDDSEANLPGQQRAPSPVMWRCLTVPLGEPHPGTGARLTMDWCARL